MGLARYTAWLMLAARLAIGAQAQGIIQAALVEAETYARQREQFGKPIRELPQVAAMLADLHMLAQASRAVLYAVSEVVDLHQGAEARGLREETRRYGRWAEALTPIAKYYTTEVANRIVYDALQIHGGNGFMQEYPIERLYRDVRITNIYEGTSQIQINWAIPRLVRGDLDDLITAMAAHAFADADLARLQEEVNRCHEIFRAVIGWLRDKDVAFREMVGPQVMDMFVEIYAAWLLLRQAARWEYKRPVAARFIRRLGPRVAMNRDLVLNARMETIEL